MSPAIYIQSFSILLATFASGASQALNFYTVPGILIAAHSDVEKITHFTAAHWRGHITLPFTFIFCGLLHFGLAYSGTTSNPRLETLAGVVTVSIVPLSVVMIEQLYLYIYSLRGKDEEALRRETGERGGVDALLVRWAWLNTFRACLPLVGAMMSLAGVLQAV